MGLFDSLRHRRGGASKRGYADDDQYYDDQESYDDNYDRSLGSNYGSGYTDGYEEGYTMGYEAGVETAEYEDDYEEDDDDGPIVAWFKKLFSLIEDWFGFEVHWDGGFSFNLGPLSVSRGKNFSVGLNY